MSIPWTKHWDTTDDGTTLRGIDLRNIQDDLDTGLNSVPSVSDPNTFTSQNNFSGVTQFGSGTDYANIAADGTVTLIGAATAWDDLRIEPIIKATGTNDPTFTQWLTDGAGSRGVYLYNFDNALVGAQKEVFYTVQMPHTWKGTTIYPHVHWLPSASQAAAAVKWGLEYTWANARSVFGNTSIIYAITNTEGAADLVQNHHYVSAFSGITPSASQSGISSVLICRLFRFSSDGTDTFTGTAGLLYSDIHFEIDSFGSRTEYIK